MESEKVTLSESNIQPEATVDSELNRDFYIAKSDLESRVVTYIFAAMVVLGFAAMVGMGIFAFVM